MENTLKLQNRFMSAEVEHAIKKFVYGRDLQVNDQVYYPHSGYVRDVDIPSLFEPNDRYIVLI